VRYELDCQYCYKLTVSRLSRQCGILNISNPIGLQGLLLDRFFWYDIKFILIISFTL
jgi:hypothetical protein